MRLRVSDEDSLFARAGRALGWSFVSTAFGRLSTLAIGIALARILGPAEFGTFAVAMVALIALLSFNELGVSLAVVRWPAEPDEIAPTVATISLLSSTVIYVGCFFGAPAFASAMGDPESVPVIRVLALCLLVNGLVATPVAILQRTFRQDRKLIADQVTNWLGALTSITLALTGMGAMSLAIGQLAGAVGGAILFAAFAPRGLRFGFKRRVARDLLKFGLPLAGSSVVLFAVTNADRFLVGALLGPVQLGFYVLAANLSNWPLSVFSQPVRAVAPAALARLQHDPPAMRGAFVSIAGLLAAVTIPVCVVLAGAAEPLIHLLYGDVWAMSATVLPWLGLLAAMRILFELCYDYFVVVGSTRVVLTVQLIWLAVLVPALWWGASHGGVAGAAAAQFVVAVLIVAPLYGYELHRAGISLGAVASRLWLPILGGALVAGVATIASMTLTVSIFAVLVAGVASLTAIALLGYRMRGAVGALRTVESG
jgi:O-antigen/teichoic acid export membrane protein